MSSEFLLFFSLLARLLGFFVFSPLFASRGIPTWVRLGLALTCSLILLPPLSATLTFDRLSWLTFIKEGVLGYLLGFLFSLLFEAAAFAGQVVGTLTGFSATELLDPISNTSSPLIAKFFMLTCFVLFLSLDLHHLLLRLLYESYTVMPINMIDATSRLFSHALAYAFYPMTALLTLTLCFAIVARFFPGLQIFWTGFPLQLLIGITAIAFAITFFAPILQSAFAEFWGLAKKVFIEYDPAIQQ